MFSFLQNLFKKKQSLPPRRAAIDRVSFRDKPEVIEPEWFTSASLFNDIAPVTAPKNTEKLDISPQMRDKLIKYVREVMPEPCASLKIYQELNSKEHTTNEMAKLIGSDPMLAARILKTANSAAYSFVSEVTYVGRAITLLGTNEVKSIVLSQSIRTSTQGFKGDPQFVEKIRNHSSMVSAVAQSLATKDNSLNQFEVATLGLLHDMGKILYSEILKSGKDIHTNRNIPQLVIEAVVASVFAELWGLSKSLCKALELTPYPIYYPIEVFNQDIISEITIVAMANFIANATGFTDGDQLFLIRDEYLSEAGVSLEPEKWITKDIVSKIENSRVSLS